jgi:hypothetical protein
VPRIIQVERKKIRLKLHVAKTEISILILFLAGRQRGLIYTENKPLGRHCKMSKSFFYAFPVNVNVNVIKLDCCTATFYTTDAKGYRGLTLVRVLISLAGGEGRGHDLFCDGKYQLLEQGLLSCKPLSIPAAGICNSSLLIITTQIMHGMQGHYSRVPMLSSCVQCVMFAL